MFKLNLDSENREKIISAVAEYLEKYPSGESVMQMDKATEDALVMLSDLADEVMVFEEED